jgi:hypothetical protein
MAIAYLDTIDALPQFGKVFHRNGMHPRREVRIERTEEITVDYRCFHSSLVVTVFLFEETSLAFLHHESNSFSSRPAQGEVAMDQCVYVAQMNIEHFRRKLLTEQDEKTRRQIIQLLAEEEAKLVTLTHAHASEKNCEKSKT